MTSHIAFDSSYVGDTWDWFESILIVMDQELWYDSTLGHSHLREFLLGMQPFCLIHRIGVHLSWSRVDFFRWPSCRGILFSVDDGFLSYGHPLEEIRCLFHIGVRDMTGWFLWCDYRSITFPSLLTDFSDDWIRTHTLVRACSGV